MDVHFGRIKLFDKHEEEFIQSIFVVFPITNNGKYLDIL